MTGQVPYYPQLDERDCGATCLRMVAEYYGKSLKMERLREITNTTEQGADLGGLELGAKSLGFDTLAVELPYDELQQGDLLPVILHWDRDHFIVVTDASFSKVSIHDPALGKRTMSRDDFEAHRYGPGRSRAAIIIRPTEGDRDQSSELKTGRNQEPKAIAIGQNPWRLIMLSFFYAGAFSVFLWNINTILQQAIDLQFREGVWQHIGSLFLASAGLVLAAYLLRNQAISYASKRGQTEIKLLIDHLQVKAADLSRPINSELYLKLISDIDDLRIWRAYNLSSMLIGLVSIIVASVFMLFTNWVWGVFLITTQVLLVLLGLYVFRSTGESKETAREAQLKQREALYEFARVLPETLPIDGGKHLHERLKVNNEKAETAFLSISSEVSAERQMIRVLMLVSAISLTGFGLYQLGYAGLQVGELLFGMLLLAVTLMPFISISMSAAKWQSLQPARLRIEELGEPSVVRTSSSLEKPQTLTITWDSLSGKEQRVSFPSSCRIALTGSDLQTRNAVVEGLLGRNNARNVRLFFDEQFDKQRSLSDFGKLALIHAKSMVASGSIASNIAMNDHPNRNAVTFAAELVGFPLNTPPRGLFSLIGFDGEGIGQDVVSRTLIARAVYANVDALLIDGATNTLKAYDEGLLMDNLLPWCEGRLLVMNAQRMNAAYGSDLIINIEESEIDSVGSHKRLLSERGTYYYQVVAAQSKLS